mgnify:CR=1 FL=1
MARKHAVVKGTVIIRKSYTGVPSRRKSGYKYGGQVRIHNTSGRGSKLTFISKSDLARFDIVELVDTGAGPLVFKRKIGHLNH